MKKYEVIEDNAGGMFLFFFDAQGKVDLGIENIEFTVPGDLDNVTLAEAEGWESRLDDPQAMYDNITSFEFGWSVVADNEGVYPDRMGLAAETVYQIEEE